MYTYLTRVSRCSTGTSAAQGQPKYYAMFGGGTGESDTTSGSIFLAPVHLIRLIDLEFILIKCLIFSVRIMTTNYISLNFPNGLLYCCLSEALWIFKRSDRYVDTI